MKILFDTDVVLDVLMDRSPFSDAAVDLFSKVESGDITGYLCGTTLTTVYYLASKVLGAQDARKEVGKLMKLFEVAPVNRVVLESALSSAFGDFEDAVVHESARHVGADALVIRNKKDYKKAKIAIYSSSELVKILALRAGA